MMYHFFVMHIIFFVLVVVSVLLLCSCWCHLISHTHSIILYYVHFYLYIYLFLYLFFKLIFIFILLLLFVFISIFILIILLSSVLNISYPTSTYNLISTYCKIQCVSVGFKNVFASSYPTNNIAPPIPLTKFTDNPWYRPLIPSSFIILRKQWVPDLKKK